MKKKQFSGLLLAATVAAVGAMLSACSKDGSLGPLGVSTFTVKDGNKDVKFDMVAVPGGSLYVGYSDTPLEKAKNVTIDSFSIGKTEVTQALWKAVMGSFTEDFDQDTEFCRGDSYPMYYVSWNDIVGTSGGGYTVRGVKYYEDGFCYKLSQKVGGNKKFRLPTEAEWEYAARGGQKSKGYKYSGSNTLGNVAWYDDNNSGSTTHPVGTKAANELGIHDLSGNVWEWCSDKYASTYPSGSNNPTGATIGSYRVYRGGGGSSDAADCRVSKRCNSTPYRLYFLGFRLVLGDQ